MTKKKPRLPPPDAVAIGRQGYGVAVHAVLRLLSDLSSSSIAEARVRQGHAYDVLWVAMCTEEGLDVMTGQPPKAAER